MKQIIACAIGCGLLVPSAGFAQTAVATLSYADPGASRVRGVTSGAATAGAAVADGDQIQTTNGRAEVALPGGSFIHLDHHARIVIRGDRAELLDGRVSVRTGSARPYLVDVATTKLTIQYGSVVEIASRADLRDMDLRVINGSVQVDTPKGSARVPDYKRCYVVGPASGPAVSNVLPTIAGDFERWALSRQVLAESTPLKGTEGGGGVAYAPWVYAPYPYYTHTYYYPSYSYYYYPYSSYSTPYYGSSYYYAPSSSYHYGGYGSYYGGSWRERYTWSAPPEQVATPRGTRWAAPVPPAPASTKGSVIPKP